MLHDTGISSFVQDAWYFWQCIQKVHTTLNYDYVHFTDFTVIPSYRELKETLVYQGLQESPDWLVCLDLLDQLGHLGLPGLLDRVIGLDL